MPEYDLYLPYDSSAGEWNHVQSMVERKKREPEVGPSPAKRKAWTHKPAVPKEAQSNPPERSLPDA
jgi:hypothetical protein